MSKGIFWKFNNRNILWKYELSDKSLAISFDLKFLNHSCITLDNKEMNSNDNLWIILIWEYFMSVSASWVVA